MTDVAANGLYAAFTRFLNEAVTTSEGLSDSSHFTHPDSCFRFPIPSKSWAQASRVTLQRRPDALLVQVSYDASDWWIYSLRTVLPTPPRTVVRIAAAHPS